MRTLLFDESPLLFVVVSVAFGVAAVLSARWMWLSITLIALYLATAALLVWFYRIPDIMPCKLPKSDDLRSPCDGVVKSVTYDPPSGRYKIVVFLNIFDQHHQFYPVEGHVVSTVHTPGSFHPAYLLEKSQYNERQVTTIRSTLGEHITITQIAGQVARRIVNLAVPGAPVEEGERMGMIKLSSRVDIEFSKSQFMPVVSPGTRVYAMKTPIAHRMK